MWTKGDLVGRAFKKIGLGDDFNVMPEDHQDALMVLDSMMALWSSKDIRLGYAQPADANGSSMDQDSGLPDTAQEAVYLNLVIRLAGEYGKTLDQMIMVTAKQAYDALLARATFPAQQQFPNTLPRGAGNKPWRGGYPSPFMPTPTDALTAEEGGDQLTFE